MVAFDNLKLTNMMMMMMMMMMMTTSYVSSLLHQTCRNDCCRLWVISAARRTSSLNSRWKSVVNPVEVEVLSYLLILSFASRRREVQCNYRKYVGQVPTYFLAVRQDLRNFDPDPHPDLWVVTFWSQNWHTAIENVRANFVFFTPLFSTQGLVRDRQTDGPSRPVMRLIRTAA